MPDLAQIRRDYARADLSESAAAADPFEQFRRWFDEALRAELDDPNAMTLATVGADGQPAARIVLLKEVDGRGFVFFTNYESRKGRDLAAHPRAALVFWWAPLERQVRVEGAVERVDAALSDRYFASRPRESRLGAWASDQSRPIANRAVLEERMEALEARYPGDDVPRPPHWGGYRVVPTRIEFWQGRQSRLHDRLQYTPSDGGWRRERLAP